MSRRVSRRSSSRAIESNSLRDVRKSSSRSRRTREDDIEDEIEQEYVREERPRASDSPRRNSNISDLISRIKEGSFDSNFSIDEEISRRSRERRERNNIEKLKNDNLQDSKFARYADKYEEDDDDDDDDDDERKGKKVRKEKKKGFFSRVFRRKKTDDYEEEEDDDDERKGKKVRKEKKKGFFSRVFGRKKTNDYDEDDYADR